MVAAGVHRAACQPAARDLQPVRQIPHVCTESAQCGGDAREPVAFLIAQPCRARDPRRPGGAGRQQGQRRSQIGRAAHVEAAAAQRRGTDRHGVCVLLNFCTKAAQILQNHAVALPGLRLQARDRHRPRERARRKPEGRVRPVALRPDRGGGAVPLPAGDGPAVRERLRGDAEAPECRKRHGDIARRFRRRGRMQLRGTGKQRQGEQQAGEKLGRNIPRQQKTAAFQPARAEKLARRGATQPDAVCLQRLPQRAERPLRQATVQTERRRHGQQKAQRRAAFAAIRRAVRLLRDRLHPQCLSVRRHARAERPQAAAHRLHVRGVRSAVHDRLAVGQRGAQQQPLQLRF